MCTPADDVPPSEVPVPIEDPASPEPAPEANPCGGVSSWRADRRQFLQYSALTAVTASVLPAGVRAAEPGGQGVAPGQRSNQWPGRIVIYRDTAMGGHLSTISQDRVEAVVFEGVRRLTGISDVGLAFAALLPGVQTTSRIAIKVNCVGYTPTRWEVARGVVSGLSRMLGETYNVANVTVYDNRSLPGHGYQASQFTFNGHTAVLSSTNSPSNYYVYPGHRLSSYLVNADYIISIPVLKAHDNPANQITVAMKNHYGSCEPSSLCGNIPGMLSLHADQHIRNKTSLIVTDAVRGTYNGIPEDPPQSWLLYPEHTPNTLFFSTDPVTNEYWARYTINDERIRHGWGPKDCTWIETASGSPYFLGVSDASDMTVLRYEAASEVPQDEVDAAGGAYLAANVPNPFFEGTRLRFRLREPGTARLRVVDASGRAIRDLGGRACPRGDSEMFWDGRDDRNRRVAAGVYFVHLEAGEARRSRRVIAAG